MMKLAIPGFGDLRLTHLVMDYNGTLARDGALLRGVPERLEKLAEDLRLLVVTADTFGTVAHAMRDLPVSIKVLAGEEAQDAAKLAVVREIGVNRVVAVGNGRNDRLMVAAAALGIGILQGEGASVQALAVADVVVTDIRDGLDLLIYRDRLRATLRN